MGHFDGKSVAARIYGREAIQEHLVVVEGLQTAIGENTLTHLAAFQFFEWLLVAEETKLRSSWRWLFSSSRDGRPI